MAWVVLPKGRKRRRSPLERLKKKQDRSHVWRVNVIYGVIFLSFGSLVLRLGYLQVTQGAVYRTKAMTSSVQSVPILPARGRIYDTNGNLLAYDQPSYSVFYTQLKGVEQHTSAIANVLAPEFHTTANSIEQTIKSQNKYATIRLFKNVSTSQLAFVTEQQSELPGVNIELDSQRVYPEGTLAGQVLGYIQPISSTDKSYYVDQKKYLLNQMVGQAGLEETYENLLQGKVGEQLLQVDLQGTSTKDLGFNPAPTAGYNLQLTLDGHLQAVAQNEVMKRVVGSKYGNQITDAAAVALDVKTGGVLAMVSYPYLDPNWYTTPGLQSKYENYLGKSGAQMNNAIQNPNDPGSTMKPSTLIAGLTYGAITPTQTFYSGGVLDVDNRREKDDAAYHTISGVMAITESSEIFFYQVGLVLGHWLGSSMSSPGGTGGISLPTWDKKYFIKGLLEMFHTEWEFGLGPKTGVDLPNEQMGKFFNEDGTKGFAEVQIDMMKIWNAFQQKGSYDNVSTPVTLVQAATGQMQQFTPMQLAQYTATIADNGVRIQPHLLQAVYPPSMSPTLDTAQQPVKVVKPHVQNKVPFKQSYIHLAQQGMEGVIENPLGTAYGPFVGSPYKAAGKTGTAEIGYNGHVVDNSVFIAYAPYQHPQIAVAVMVPGGGYGAQSAAPIAKKIMDTYFKEHHEIFKKSQWESTTIPANWKSSPAYAVPESRKN